MVRKNQAKLSHINKRKLCDTPYQFIGKLISTFQRKQIKYKKILSNVKENKHTNKKIQINGTAFLIGPNILLTCAHNLYLREFDLLADEVKFFPFNQNQNIVQQNFVYSLNFQIHPLYRNQQIMNEIYDIGMIVLKPNKLIKNSIYVRIYFDWSLQKYPEGKILLISWSKSEQKNSTKLNLYEEEQKPSYQDQMKLYYNHTTQSGQSGSPILYKQNNEIYAVGIHKGQSKKHQMNCGLIFSTLKNTSQMMNQLTEQLKVQKKLLNYKQSQQKLLQIVKQLKQKIKDLQNINKELKYKYQSLEKQFKQIHKNQKQKQKVQKTDNNLQIDIDIFEVQLNYILDAKNKNSANINKQLQQIIRIIDSQLQYFNIETKLTKERRNNIQNKTKYFLELSLRLIGAANYYKQIKFFQLSIKFYNHALNVFSYIETEVNNPILKIKILLLSVQNYQLMQQYDQAKKFIQFVCKIQNNYKVLNPKISRMQYLKLENFITQLKNTRMQPTRLLYHQIFFNLQISGRKNLIYQKIFKDYQNKQIHTIKKRISSLIQIMGIQFPLIKVIMKNNAVKINEQNQIKILYDFFSNCNFIEMIFSI